MMISNTEHSVRARLQNLARSSDRPFQEVLQYYGLERFLYRLSQSPYAGRFLLKGALMLRVWGAADVRPTRDIDLLGFVDNDIPPLVDIMKEACEIGVVDDGLQFEASTVVGKRIKEGADYQGVRIKFTAFLGKTRIPMQIDLGFGDVVHPAPLEQPYPTLLEFPAPQLRMYPREALVAEKFEAILNLGTTVQRHPVLRI